MGRARVLRPLLLWFARFDLLDQPVDLLRRELAEVFRHVSFAIVNDVAQVVGRSRNRLFGDERGSAEMSPFRGFAVTLGAVFFVDRVRNQCRVIRRLREQGCESTRQTGGDDQLRNSHGGPGR
jgi:hypothetical protein